jgi:hypothetical protein
MHRPPVGTGALLAAGLRAVYKRPTERRQADWHNPPTPARITHQRRYRAAALAY